MAPSSLASQAAPRRGVPFLLPQPHTMRQDLPTPEGFAAVSAPSPELSVTPYSQNAPTKLPRWHFTKCGLQGVCRPAPRPPTARLDSSCSITHRLSALHPNASISHSPNLCHSFPLPLLPRFYISTWQDLNDSSVFNSNILALSSRTTSNFTSSVSK